MKRYGEREGVRSSDGSEWLEGLLAARNASDLCQKVQQCLESCVGSRRIAAHPINLVQVPEKEMSQAHSFTPADLGCPQCELRVAGEDTVAAADQAVHLLGSRCCERL